MSEIGVEAEFALEEPCLRYHRIENDCPFIYTQTTITAMAAHYKFIVFGCKDGAVYILDHLGHRIDNGYYKKHFLPVNEVSISDDGDYIITCADDGLVVIHNLTDPKQVEVINLRRIVKSIAIGPAYRSTRKFATGDRKVVLHSRGILNRRTSEDLYVPPGYVRALEWRGNLLIWADDVAVRVYDVRKRTMINYIPRTTENQEFLEGHLPCHLMWHSDTCFLIGWGKVAQVCHVVYPPQSCSLFEAKWSLIDEDRESVSSFQASMKTSPTSSIITTTTPSPQVTVRISSQVDVGNGIICGLATHQERVIFLLYPAHSIETLASLVDPPPVPQILVVDVGESLSLTASANQQQLTADQISIISSLYDYEEVNREEITLKFSPETRFQGLGLVSIPGEDTHFIFSSIDAIYAQTPSSDDRIEWFLEQNLPQRALQIANECPNNLVKYSPKELGMTYLNELLKEKNFIGAAALCANILTDGQSWKDQVYRFLQLGQLQTLVPYLPVSTDLLGPAILELVLKDLMTKSPTLFLQKLKDWAPNSGLYSIDSIIAAIVEQTSPFSLQSEMYVVAKENPDVLVLWRALMLLYEHAGLPEKGLELSIHLKDIEVFDLLRRQLPQGGRFGNVVRKQIIALFGINDQKAILLMLDCVRELPVDFVVQELEAHPLYLYKYLDALNNRNPHSALPHIPCMVGLYASYAREKLLPFLRSTDRYPLNEALNLCQGLGFIPETVYLLTRVGRRKDALRLLMEKGEEDALLVQNKALTAEQRKAEVAAHAIAYCLEEDPSSSGRRTYCDYYPQIGSHTSTFSARIRRRRRQGIFFTMNRSDDDDSEDSGRGEEEDVESEEANKEAESTSREAGELWKQVVLFAVDKPNFICALLKHASTECIDPRLLLRKIAPNTQIPKLKDSLVNLLHNTQMQVEVRRSCQRILLTDSHDIFTSLVGDQGRGILVTSHLSNDQSSSTCRLCRQSLLSLQSYGVSISTSVLNSNYSEGFQPGLAVYRCSHTFHKACILKFGKFMTCPICVQEH